MNKLVILSYAKLNLYLSVLNKRKDGYHNILTIFERIDLADKITLKALPGKTIRIICAKKDVPKDKTNLCLRAAGLLKERLKIKQGVRITIKKNIPVAAGLGGGSGNAAATLLGLNKLWKLNLSEQKLVDYAKDIGSDVPFFIYRAAFAQGTGRGDKIRILKPLKGLRLWHLLVVPKIKVSTPLVYQKYDHFFKLTPPGTNVKIITSALRRNGAFLAEGLLFNSLEEVSCRFYPEVQRIKDALRGLGLKTIKMTGSGPAVFALLNSRKEAVTLARKVAKVDGSWRVFVTRTV